MHCNWLRGTFALALLLPLAGQAESDSSANYDPQRQVDIMRQAKTQYRQENAQEQAQIRSEGGRAQYHNHSNQVTPVGGGGSRGSRRRESYSAEGGGINGSASKRAGMATAATNGTTASLPVPPAAPAISTTIPAAPSLSLMPPPLTAPASAPPLPPLGGNAGGN